MKLMNKHQMGVHTPKGGWKPRTWYLVEGCVNTLNPVHTCVLYTGFLNSKGNPGSYSGITSEKYLGNGDMSIRKYKYIKVIKILHEVDL